MLRRLSFAALQEYLEDQESVDFTEFAEKIWPNIREIYKVKEQIAEGEAGKDESAGTGEEIEVSLFTVGKNIDLQVIYSVYSFYIVVDLQSMTDQYIEYCQYGIIKKKRKLF